jgi:hypothetical protein
MVGGKEPGEPVSYGSNNPGLMAPEGPGAGAALPKTLAPVLCTTKSYSEFLAQPPSRVPAPTISTLAVPCGVPPMPDTSVSNATTGRQWATGTNDVRLL